MRELRVSVVVIQNSTGEYSVGLCFLKDLLYLLQMPDFLFYMTQPVMTFLKELNSHDDSYVDDSSSDSFEHQYTQGLKDAPMRLQEGGMSPGRKKKLSEEQQSFDSHISSDEDLNDVPFFQKGAFGTQTLQTDEPPKSINSQR